MPATALPENYCVCVGEDGAPREIGRSGSAVTYKAMGYQSGQAVALQLIPLTSVSEAGRAQFEVKARAVRKLKHPNIARVLDVRVEDDHLVFATEYLQGETAEAWVVAHGPMPPDAVVRVALQVVSALAEAAFHSLSHRSIQPANLMIVSGSAPDGSWPYVKLLNFGLAGLKLYSETKEEIAPPIGPAFASPEQLEKGKVDFRSEIFSLGATLCFLLTGAVPLAKSAAGERRLPSRVRIPRPLRRLLRRMLRINPDERPKDPLLLTDELRRCLQKVERRRPTTAPIPIPLETPVAQTDRSRFLAPLLTAATMLLLCAGLGAVLLPGQVHWWTHRDRPLDSIGVPVGVPDTTPTPPPRATETAESPAPAVVAETSSSPATAEAPAFVPPPATPEASPPPIVAQSSPVESPAQLQPSVAPASSPADVPHVQEPPLVAQETTPEPAQRGAEVTVNNRMAEPPPRIEAPPPQEAPVPQAPEAPLENVQEPPTEQKAPAEPTGDNIATRSETAAPPPSAPSPQPTLRPKIASTSAKSARTNSPVNRRAAAIAPRARSLPQMRVGTTQAHFVGTTDEGKWILQLPSGSTVVTPPLPDVNDAPVISHHKVRKVPSPPRAVPTNPRPPVLVLPPEH